MNWDENGGTEEVGKNVVVGRRKKVDDDLIPSQV